MHLLYTYITILFDTNFGFHTIGTMLPVYNTGFIYNLFDMSLLIWPLRVLGWIINYFVAIIKFWVRGRVLASRQFRSSDIINKGCWFSVKYGMLTFATYIIQIVPVRRVIERRVVWIFGWNITPNLWNVWKVARGI